LRYLRDHVFALDLAHVNYRNAVLEMEAAERTAERFQVLARQRRTLHLRDERAVGERIEKAERLHVDHVAAALEKERVGLDAVEQRGREPLRRLHAGGAEIIGEDRRGRAVVGAEVGEARSERRALRMVVDDQIDAPERLLEIGRLHVDERELGAVGVEIAGVDALDLDFEQAEHREILRAGDLAKSHDRRRRALPSQQLAQRERAADRVGVGVVLQQDVDFILLMEERADDLDTPPIYGIEELRRAELVEDIL